MSVKNELQELCQKRGCPIPDYREKCNTGPSHSPCFAYEVTVKWDGVTFTETAEGRKKKEAQQNVASAMLRRIKTLMEGSSQSYSTSLASPSRAKSDLQEFLQQHRYSLPDYQCLPPKGPSHQPVFTVKLTALSGDGVVWKGTGEGGTKKEAENVAAKKCLQYLRELEEGGIPIISHQNLGPPLGLVDATTDQDISHSMLKYKPVYTTCTPGQSDGEGVWLCMGLTTQLISPPVAAHGQGTSQEEAERDAALNLRHNTKKILHSYI